MNAFSDRLREDQRLRLLQTLAQSSAYTADEHSLRAHLGQFGHQISADLLRSHLAWLEEQALVILSGEQIQVATLTLQGEDAARGVARVPGIARPRPGEGR